MYAAVPHTQERWNAVGCIVLLALCESFVPTILLSALPLSVHRSVYGAAFAFSEVRCEALELLLAMCCVVTASSPGALD